MTDRPSIWVVEPGAEGVGTIMAIKANLLAVRMTGPHGPVVVPVEVGALKVLPGYEGVWSRLIGSRLSVGETVRVTWIAREEGHLMQAMVEDSRGSVDASAIVEGWALPYRSAGDVSGVRQIYRSAIEQASRNQNGAWGDLDLAGAMRAEVKAVYGQHIRMSPSFLAAYPGLSVAMVLIVVVAIGWLMRQENEQVSDQLRDQSRVRKSLGWFINIHTRFIPRPLSSTTASPRAKKPNA